MQLRLSRRGGGGEKNYKITVGAPVSLPFSVEKNPGQIFRSKKGSPGATELRMPISSGFCFWGKLFCFCAAYI